MKPGACCCILSLAALAAAACSPAGSTAEIEATRRATRPSSPVLPGARPDQRFFEPDEGSSDEVAGQREAVDPREFLDYDLPAGWKELPLEGDRLVNLRPAGDPEASCYLTFLSGGGRLSDNVNRWRKQLGAEPLSEDAVAALPTHQLLNRDATLVEVTGTYTGMGEAPRPNYRLLGLIVAEPTGGLFLKFVAPAARVEAERAGFLAFASSLRLSATHATAGGATLGAPAPEQAAGGLSWKVPQGWIQQPPRQHREVSFTVGQGGECYISRLGAGAGGLRMNLDRWRDQFGLAPLSDQEFSALQPVRALGLEAPLLELSGSYSGMGSKVVEGQALLGVALFRAQDSLFVKFTGPAEVVRAERANFLAFVASLEEDA